MPLTREQMMGMQPTGAQPSGTQPQPMAPFSQLPSHLPRLKPSTDTSPQGWAASHPWLNTISNAMKSVQSGIGGFETMGPIKEAARLGGEGAKLMGDITGIKPVGVDKGLDEWTKPQGVGETLGAGATQVAEFMAAPEIEGPRLAKSAFEGAKSGATTYAQTKDPLTSAAVGVTSAVAPVIGDVVNSEAVKPFVEPIKKGVAKALGWISQKSYAQALRPLMSKEIAQDVSGKVSELAPIGTKGMLKRQASKMMSTFETVVNNELKGPLGKVKMGVDEIVGQTDKYMSEVGETISSTGIHRQNALDAARQRLLSVADKQGNIVLEKLQAIKTKWGNDIKPLFKKNPADLTMEQHADLDLYYAMRDAIASKSPTIAAENAKYHLGRIIDDAITRTEALDLRKNWTGLIGNVYAAHLLQSGQWMAAIGSLIADKLTGSTLSRTLVGAGAKGLEKAIMDGLNIPEAMAKIAAPMVSQYIQHEGTNQNQTSKKGLTKDQMMQLRGATPTP